MNNWWARFITGIYVVYQSSYRRQSRFSFFIKYGLIDITLDELKETETMEMKRLRHEEKLSLRKIGMMFSLTDSGVYRRIQAFDKNVRQNPISSCCK